MAGGGMGALADRGGHAARGGLAVSRLLADMGPAGLLHLAYFLVLTPWAVMRRGTAAPAPDLTRRRQHYRRVTAQLASFGVLSGLVAWRNHLPLWGAPRAPVVAWAAAASLVALLYHAIAPYRRARIARGDPRALLLAPDPADVPWWAAVALSAGVAEELTYRGVASSLLLLAGMPAAAVVVVVNAAFGLAHATRGWVHVGVTFGIGAALHLLVLASGSLWPAMAAHAVYDFLAGLSYARLARRTAAGPVGAAAAS